MKNYKEIEDIIVEYISDGSIGGWFSSRDFYNDNNLKTQEEKSNARKIFNRLANSGKLERNHFKDGRYRVKDNLCTEIEWVDADTSNTIDLLWPFNMEELFTIYPRNIGIIAGAPNAGKTAFCLNFIRLNMDRFSINYFNSEMGAEELKLRLSNFPGMELKDWHFSAYDRTENFADVIKPDGINIIDYLEITDNFYKVGEEIKRIYDASGDGFNLICIQKNPSHKDVKIDLGRGASFALEKPRLYLAMDSGELRIVKAKNWRDHSNNPNGKVFKFKLIQGAEMVEEQRWDY